MVNEVVKGFRDIEGSEAAKREKLRGVIVGTFEKYGFNSVETPIIEYEGFVKGENTNDEAVSEIFKLKDRGERSLALRYEFTFQLKRLALNKKLPYKRYQIGPVFRDEPIGENRFRQFTQCDVDVIGSSFREEAEILSLTKEILENIGVKNTIYFNNRNLLNEILESINIKSELRDQVMREIDKLDKLPEKEVRENLKKLGAEKLLSILKNNESYFKKYNFYKDVQELKKYCNLYGIKLNFQPSLVRGLSYYNGSVFEIKSGIKETICAGGSYLVNGIQSTGISFGLDRLTLVSKMDFFNKKVLVISLDKEKEAVNLSKLLRKNDISSSLFYGKPSKALDYANSYSFNYVIFVGENEIKSKKFKLRDMVSGKEYNVAEKDLVKRLS